MCATFCKALKLLSAKQQTQYVVVALLLTFTSLAEMVGVAAIIPAITALIDFQAAIENRYLSVLYEFSGRPQKSTFLVMVISSAVGFVWGGAILSAIGVYARHRFVRNIDANFAVGLYQFYMAQPIESFYSRSASEFLRNINGLSERVATGVVDASLVVISRGIQLLTVVCLLTILNAEIAISIAAVIGGSYLIIYRIIKKKILGMSAEHFEEQACLNRAITGSYKDYRAISIDGQVESHRSHLADIKFSIAKKLARIEILGVIPRNLIEVLGISLLLIAGYQLGQSESNSHYLVSTISMFAIAAYKMLPSAQQIYHAVSRLTAALHILDNASDFLDGLDMRPKAMVGVKDPNFKAYGSIVVQNLNYAYPDGKQVFSNLCCDFKLEGIVRVCGLSGVGKTTFIELLAGLRRPLSGKILVNDLDLCQIPQADWWSNISYVTQDGFLSAGTLRDNVIGMAVRLNLERYRQVSHICGLDSIETDIFQEGGGNVSGGQKSRVLLARALYKKSKIILLDEVFSPMDVHSAKEILERIRSFYPDRCLIMISHRDSEFPDSYQTVEIPLLSENYSEVG